MKEWRARARSKQMKIQSKNYIFLLSIHETCSLYLSVVLFWKFSPRQGHPAYLS